MKTLLILLAGLFLSGCATTGVYTTSQTTVRADVIHTVPQAIGTYSVSYVYGTPVWYNPHPVYYVNNHINYRTRIVYNHHRRQVPQRIACDVRLSYHPSHPCHRRHWR